MSLPALRDDRELAPLREELERLGLRALPAIVEALLALPEVPGWMQRCTLGPWWQISSAAWGRYPVGLSEERRRGRIAEAYVWGANGRWWRYDGESIVPTEYSSRNAAMALEDTRALEAGWLHDDVRPPEAEPAPAPVPAAEGEGVRAPTLLERVVEHARERSRERQEEADEAVQWVAPRRSPLVSASTRHSWNTVRSGTRYLLRCERCGMWRESRRRRHLLSSYTFNEAYEALSWGNGERRAGRCVPREAP